MTSGGLEDGEHDGENHEGRDSTGEEEERGFQNGAEAADFPLGFMGEDFLGLSKEAGQFTAFHAYPAEVMDQREGETALFQGIRKVLASVQMGGHKGKGFFRIPISQHLPGIPEGFGQGAAAFQKGRQGSAETDQQDAPVEPGTVEQILTGTPACPGEEEKNGAQEGSKKTQSQMQAIVLQPQAQGQGQGCHRREGNGKGIKKKGKRGKDEGQNDDEKAEGEGGDKEGVGQGTFQLADETVFLQIVL